MICTELIERFRWGPRGVGLYRHSWSAGKANESTL